MQKTKTILVTPLNWGLGHASRCIPIIYKLLEANHKVIIAADGQALQLLRSEFPELHYEVFPGIKANYSKFIPIPLLLILRAPKLFKSIKTEYKTVKNLVKRLKVDGIISDNRYGCYHKKIPSVIITHQIAVKTPFFKRNVQNLVEKLLSKFDSCWVPDFKGQKNLSGELSHVPQSLKKVEFIGPLTRFKKASGNVNYSRKLLVLLSGPEPNRTVFETKIVRQLKNVKHEVLIVQGKLTEHLLENKNLRIEFAPHLPTKQLQKEIEASEVVLCRSGYSSLMDLSRIGKNVLLVPTPGQSEQEYLAKHLSEMGWCYSVKQSALNISKDLEKALEYKPFSLEEEEGLLSLKLQQWMAQIN